MKNFSEELSPGNSNQSNAGGVIRLVPITMMNRRRSGAMRGGNVNVGGTVPAPGGIQANGMGGSGNPGGTPTTPTPPAPGGGGGMHGGNTGGTPPPGGGGGM